MKNSEKPSQASSKPSGPVKVIGQIKTRMANTVLLRCNSAEFLWHEEKDAVVVQNMRLPISTGRLHHLLIKHGLVTYRFEKVARYQAKDNTEANVAIDHFKKHGVFPNEIQEG